VSFPSSLEFLDAQHDELNSKMRDLGKLRSGRDDEKVMSQVRHILKLLREHTMQEEHAMASHGYPDLELHKKYHENVLASVETMFEFFPPMLEYREAIANYLQNRYTRRCSWTDCLPGSWMIVHSDVNNFVEYQFSS
jgi:hemerythrin-like metal-binding protein